MLSCDAKRGVVFQTYRSTCGVFWAQVGSCHLRKAWLYVYAPVSPSPLQCLPSFAKAMAGCDCSRVLATLRFTGVFEREKGCLCWTQAPDVVLAFCCYLLHGELTSLVRDPCT